MGFRRSFQGCTTLVAWQGELSLYLGLFFQFVHNVRRRGKAPIGTLVGGLIGFANPPYSLSRDSELLCR